MAPLIPSLCIYTLGPFRLVKGEKELGERDWPWHTAQLLLKAFIAQEKREVPKDVLMECLWPGGRPESSAQNFRTTLYRLRSALRPLTGGELSPLLLTRGTVSLHPLCWLDLAEFKGSLEEGRGWEVRERREKALENYTRAAELYQGDFLAADLYAQWAASVRERLKAEYLELLFKIADLKAAGGDLEGAIAACRKVLEKDDCYEEAYYRLMLYYWQSDRPSLALRTYEQCRRTIKAELDIEPHWLTTQLHQEIFSSLRSGARGNPAKHSTWSVRDTLERISRTADGCYAVDRDQRIILWNRAAERLLGWKPEEVLGRPCYEVIAGRDKKGRLFCQRFCPTFVAVKRGEAVVNYDLLCRSKAGGEFRLNVSIIPIPANRGEVAAVVHLFRGIGKKRKRQV
ncbi:MAG: BTAD domain-containing putative transcriptional regulator [Candidatus Binatia bacterium]